MIDWDRIITATIKTIIQAGVFFLIGYGLFLLISQ